MCVHNTCIYIYLYVTCCKPILSKFIKIITKTTCEEHVYECVHVHVYVHVCVCVCVCVPVFLISLYGPQRSSYLALYISFFGPDGNMYSQWLTH